MLDVKSNINTLIASIYECQKKIILNRRLIRELDNQTDHDALSKYTEEIKILETKILELQKALKEKYFQSL
jgi:hypothetical protein